jgi:hypothetical protein
VPQPDGLPDSAAPTWRPGDLVTLTAALALIIIAAVVGYQMDPRGLPVVLPRPPLLASWHPRTGWGTPLAILDRCQAYHSSRRHCFLRPGDARRCCRAGKWLMQYLPYLSVVRQFGDALNLAEPIQRCSAEARRVPNVFPGVTRP